MKNKTSTSVLVGVDVEFECEGSRRFTDTEMKTKDIVCSLNTDRKSASFPTNGFSCEGFNSFYVKKVSYVLYLF